MISALLRRIVRKMQPKGLVLMYHRIAEPRVDPWELAVSPRNFEEQLAVLRELGDVVSLDEMLERRKGLLPARRLALTFDDGYADNYSTALDMLEEADVPACFFICSRPAQSGQLFWWDELAELLLLTERLPARLELKLGEQNFRYELESEEVLNDQLRKEHRAWRAEQTPPSRRAALYLDLWKELQISSPDVQQQAMEQLRSWAAVPAKRERATMTAAQLRAVHEHPLFSLGGHTATHPALAHWPQEVQRKEIAEGKHYLHELLEEPPRYFSYPYGNYNEQTRQLAHELGFKAAFTTEEALLRPNTDNYQLGRFMVRNWSGKEFKQRLKGWFEGKE